MGFEYWFMFPIGAVVATIAMSTLIGGATFFSPLFILILKLEPHTAVATAVMIQTFGFGTGLIRYIKKKSIDYTIGTIVLFITIPFSILGVWMASKLNPNWIRFLLGFMLIFIGYRLFYVNVINIKRGGVKIVSIRFKSVRGSKEINLKRDAIRKTFFYSAVSSLFFGVTSTGLGEVLGYDWIKNTNARIQTIVSTTVFVIAITTFVTSLSHFYHLFATNFVGLIQAKEILIFAVPGVVIGALIGTQIIYRINQEKLLKFISIVLMITGVVCFISV